MKNTFHFFIVLALVLLFKPHAMAQKGWQHHFSIQGTTYFNPTLETVSVDNNQISLSAREREKSNLYMLLYTLQSNRWHWQLGLGRTHYVYQVENAASTFLVNEPNIQVIYRGGSANGKRDYVVWHLGTHYKLFQKGRLGILAGVNLQMNRYISPEGFSNANDIVVNKWGEVNKTDFTAIPALDLSLRLTKHFSVGLNYWLNFYIDRSDGLYFSELSVNSNGSTFRNAIQSNHPLYEHALGMRLTYLLTP